MEKIIQLSNLFADYQLYPKQLFTEDTPVKAFQRMYPDNSYSIQIEEFLKYHDYKPARRGADLPWWGSSYFSEAKSQRVFIISQDSLSVDAGSIVFFANLFPVCKTKEEYERYHSSLGPNQSFRYSSWVKLKELFEQQWKLYYDFLYITDAAKVYKQGSWKDRAFDKPRSKKLLEKEIKFCNPDLIIILGGPGLSLLLPDAKFSDIVEIGKPISILSIKTVVAPFPIGNGPTQPRFKERLELATEKIKNVGRSLRGFELMINDRYYEKFEEECQRQYERALTEKEKEMIDNLRKQGFTDEHIMGLFND